MSDRCTGCTKHFVRQDCPKHSTTPYVRTDEMRYAFLLPDGRMLDKVDFPQLAASLAFP